MWNHNEEVEKNLSSRGFRGTQVKSYILIVHITFFSQNHIFKNVDDKQGYA